MSKTIMLCADDFAQNEAISEGILSLAQLKRINAISCLVNSPYWDELYGELERVKHSSFIGLHLNLTDGQPRSAIWRKLEGEHFTGLPNLLKKAYLRQLNLQAVIAEIQAQLDVFTHTMHVYPDFIDGHQHIHQFPIIRRALFEVHKRQMGHVDNAEDETDYTASFFRNTYNGWRDLISMTSFPKCQMLALLGGRRFKRALIRYNIPTNTSFAGIYNFRHASHYRDYFRRFLAKTRDGGLIMCHPGLQSQDKHDPLHAFRHHEFNYLMSDVFLSDLEDNSFLLKKKNSS